MKTLLVIAYYFPPAGGVGVQRPAKFVKYLPQFGWSPLVLTVDPKVYKVRDDSGLKDIPAEVRGIRTSLTKLPSAISGQGLDWMYSLLRKINELCSHQKIQAMYITGNPFLPFVAGYYARRKFDVPYVLDFRDAWALHPYAGSTVRDRIVHKVWQSIERKVIEASSKVLCVCEPMWESFIEYYADEPIDKFVVLTNGFDRSDMQVNTPLVKATKAPGHILLTYTGKFTNYRSPIHFLKSLKLVIDTYPELVDKLRCLFVGHFGASNLQILKEMKLDDIVTVTGRVPHEESIDFLYGSDILLLITGGHRSEQTGKVFEYIATGKPVLALAPADGAAAQVLKEAGTGVIVDPFDHKQIAAGLLRLIKSVRSGQLPDPNWDEINKYERQRLTGQLAEILNGLLA